MKKTKICSVILIVIMCLAAGLIAREPKGFVPAPMAKTTINQTTRTMSNISNWGYWMYASGKSAGQPNGSSGGIYPRGTAGAIYLDGLVWGGKYDGNDNDIRVGGVTYSVGTVPGWINADGTVADGNDERVKIWRIRPDYATLTYDHVRKDAMELNELSSLSEVSDAMCQAVIDQYEEDWLNWPSDLGAPTYDDGTPGIANADQIIWYVCHDLDVTAAMSLAGSQPIGIELQVTAWAYAQPDARLGQIVFKKYKFINKSGVDVTDMYVSQWCDPDLGNYGDDFVGCDTTLSMGFAYNGTDIDDQYDAFGLAPAAMGYDFFQGPMVDGVAGEDRNKNGVDDANDYAVWDLKKVGPGKINLPMSSFGWFAAGSDISDPTQAEYEGTLQWYNLMSGFIPTDDIVNPSTWTHGNISGNPVTKYPLSGDPVTGEGYIDGKDGYFEPGDRRMCLTAGPFDFKNGEIQEVVIAVIGGLGGDRFSSITAMKGTDEIAQKVYDTGFSQIPKPPATPQVSVTTFEESILLSWADIEAVAVTEGPQELGYKFEGYNIYQLPSASSTKDQAVKIATFDINNSITNIKGVRLSPDLGEVEMNIQNGSNTGIQRYIAIDKDYVNGNPLYEGKTYYYAVTAYNQDVTLMVDRALESALIPIGVTVQEALPGNQANVETLSDITVEHSVGTAGGTISGTVIDPYQTTGDDYEVYFNKQHYYLSGDGKWYTTNYPDSIGKLSKTTDLQGSYLVGASVYSTNAGTIDLKYWVNVISPDYDYCEGVLLTFPSDITINSATSSNGVEIVLDKEANTVMFGNTIPTGGGAFAGGELITVNVNTFTPPLSADYKMFDDGWAVLSNYILSINTDVNPPDTTFAYDLGDGIVDGVGSVVISEIGNDFKTMNHWNVKNLTTNEDVVEDQYILNGLTEDHIANGDFILGGEGATPPIFDGVQLNLVVGYAAPLDFTGVDQTFADGSTKYRPMWHMNYFYDNDLIHAIPYMIDSYMQHSWSGGNGTARSIDAYGFGTNVVDLLQRDYELRFTGEYDDAIGNYHPIKDGTGSLAILRGARGYDLATHPDPNNPGDGTAFFVRIPFEVWDMEAPDGPQQVSILIYDRKGDPAAADFYAFNPADRMYCEFLVEPYADVIAADPNSFLESDKLTWNTIFWNCDWTTGDVLHFIYDNPIQAGSDTWTFSTVAPTLGDQDLINESVKKINVFPNPYYANNALATHRFDDYVTFTHLPAKAKIRIFNLNGIQVKVLDKDDPNSQFLKWDLTNEASLPVASGMYIAHIDCPDLGKEKVLKIAIIQKEQILEYY